MMRNCLCVALFLYSMPIMSSQTSGADASSIPNVVKFSSAIRDLDGRELSNSQHLTFALYTGQDGGASLWTETQTVVLDNQGRYSILLGSASPGGIPAGLFASGETQWIGVTPDDGIERPRIPIATVPYAFKAAEADSIGGMRPNDFVSVQQLNTLLASGAGKVAGAIFATGGSGTPAAGVGDSMLSNINADSPHGFSDAELAKLRFPNIFEQPQVFQAGIVLSATGVETVQNNFVDSAPLDFESSIVQPLPATPLVQIFRWVSQPSVSSSGNPNARLNLLFGQNGSAPSPTGFSINSDGTVNFSANQVLPPSAVMEAISTAQNGSSAGGTNGGQQSPTVNTSLYEWTDAPTGSAILAGPNVVTLAPCPRGVNGTDAWHFLYISKTGTPETVLITGGTCTSGAKTGTIEFTAQYAHPAGYSIGSSTDGVQEAIVVAAGNSGIARNVTIDPGSHIFRARLSVRANSITITGSGASITCAMTDTCVMLGDPGNSNEFSQIVLNGLRLAAGIPSGTWTAIEDNGEGSQINNFAPASSAVSGASFGSLIQVDNDQAGVITGLNTGLAAWSRCDTSFCSTAIVGFGKNNDAGLFSVEDSELNLACTANGIDNQNGNTMSVSNTEIQAYPQFGVRSRSTYGDVPNVQFNRVYEEIGNCVNPLGTGMAGLIVENGYANVTSSAGPAGELPQFANTGTTQYNYSIVVNSSIMGTSPAYLAGNALTSGTGAIPVRWNQVGDTGVVTYDVLRTVGSNAVAPFGTGPFAVATEVPALGCINKVCTFVDDASVQPATYAVSTDANYWPALTLWPGNVILTTAWDYQNTGGGPSTFYSTDVLNSGSIVNSAGAYAPSVSAQVCNPQLTTSIWVQCSVGAGTPIVGATVLQLSGVAGLKGRDIYEITPANAIGATEVITLADANPAKTMASPNNRASWDANDTYIGFDQPSSVNSSSVQLAFGAGASITNYTGSLPDNVHWGERLTPNQKTFNVPVLANDGMMVNGSLISSSINLTGGGLGPGFPWQLIPGVGDSFSGFGGLGSNWTNATGTCQESAGQASGATFGIGGYASSVYNGTFDPNQIAGVVVTNGYDSTAGVGVRMSTSTLTGYACVSRGTGVTNLMWFDSTGFGHFLGTAAEVPSGDTLQASAVGTTIECVDNGKVIIQVTDTNVTSGSPGIIFEANSNGTVANFQAGSLIYNMNGTANSLPLAPVPFEKLPVACSSTTEGSFVAVTDSPSATYNAIVTIGGGLNHLPLYCNGTNWTVH